MKSNCVSHVVNAALCCGCGICSTVCSRDAIEIGRNSAGFIVANVNASKCITCGKCLRVCPKEEVYGIKYKNAIKPQPKVEIDKVYDRVKNGYLCYAVNREIQEVGQSGGVVTSLLSYMLDKGIIDEAFINAFDSTTNTNHMITAKSLTELLNGAGSFYSQAVASGCVDKTQSAVVVLGCQAEALRKREQVNGNVPKYLLGLFCGGNFSGKYYEKLEGKHKDRKVENFRFRDKRYGGWPGNVSFDSNGKKIVVDKSIRMKYKDLYECSACDYCKERLNVNSDLAVGDPWGIECAEKERGYSVVLTYTDKGEHLIEGAISDGYIVGEKLELRTIIEGQAVNEEYYKEYLNHVSGRVRIIEGIKLQLRRRTFNSSNRICYYMNFYLLQLFLMSVAILKKLRRR